MIFLNGEVLEVFRFSAGETHFELKKEVKESDQIEIFFESNEDIITFMLLNSIYKAKYIRYSLFIPYMPYSRQDRQTTPGSPDSFSAIRNILELSNAQSIKTLDLHNTGVLTPNSKIKSYIDTGSIINTDYAGIIIPDEGAKRRCEYFSRTTGIPILFQGSKKRDPSTGNLSGYHLELVNPYTEGPLLVFDDICDGGGTFILLAQEFRKLYSNKLHLLTSHGIYSKGKSAMLEHYESVKCIYKLLKGNHS